MQSHAMTLGSLKHNQCIERNKKHSTKSIHPITGRTRTRWTAVSSGAEELQQERPQRGSTELPV